VGETLAVLERKRIGQEAAMAVRYRQSHIVVADASPAALVINALLLTSAGAIPIISS